MLTSNYNANPWNFLYVFYNWGNNLAREIEQGGVWGWEEKRAVAEVGVSPVWVTNKGNSSSPSHTSWPG